MSPQISHQRTCSNMSRESLPKQQNCSSTDNNSNSKHQHERDHLQGQTSNNDRVPPLVTLEEGTQTENYHGSFYCANSDHVTSEATISSSGLSGGTNEGTNNLTLTSQTVEYTNSSLYSGGSSNGEIQDDSRIGGAYVDDSSSISESGESVIERLSKSVSRLLNRVSKYGCYPSNASKNKDL